MADHTDLTKLLQDWPFEPGKVNVRLINGSDDRKILQVRLELGVLQMELTGRPDGAKPHEFQSLFEYHEDRQQRYAQQSGNPEGFVLSEDDCGALREEAVQYYHRYVALFALGDYKAVIHDATRNLRVLDLCRDFATTDHDRTVLEQFRPGVIAMRARAEAELALGCKQPQAALTAIDMGMEEIVSFYEEIGAADDADQSAEILLLRGMRDALVPKLPASEKVELQQRLQAAIETENYELAAILRDELKLL